MAALVLLASVVPESGHAQDRESFCVSCSAEADVDGFYAAVLVTDSEDWVEIWNNQSDERPPFNVRDRPFYLGETAYVLTIFSNAAMRGGTMDVLCDFTVTGPNEDVTKAGPDPCVVGPISGSPEDMFLSDVHMYFEVEEGDASGLWTYDVGVTDVVRGVRVPLSVALLVDSTREAPAP